MTKAGRTLRLLLRKRWVQVLLVLAVIPLGYATWWYSVPRFDGVSLYEYVERLRNHAAADLTSLRYDGHSDPGPWPEYAFLETNRLDLLFGALSHVDPLVRAGACTAIGRLGPTTGRVPREAISPLVRALDDADDRVRFHAAHALWRSGDPAALPPLRDRVHDSAADSRELAIAAVTIHDLTSDTATQELARSAVVRSFADSACSAFLARELRGRPGLWGPEVHRLVSRVLIATEAPDSDGRRIRANVLRALADHLDRPDERRTLYAALCLDLCSGEKVRRLDSMLLFERIAGQSTHRVGLAAELRAAHGRCRATARGEECEVESRLERLRGG